MCMFSHTQPIGEGSCFSTLPLPNRLPCHPPTLPYSDLGSLSKKKQIPPLLISSHASPGPVAPSEKSETVLGTQKNSEASEGTATKLQGSDGLGVETGVPFCFSCWLKSAFLALRSILAPPPFSTLPSVVRGRCQDSPLYLVWTHNRDLVFKIVLSCLVANRFQLNKEARRWEGGSGGLVKMQGVGEVGGRREEERCRQLDWKGGFSYHVLPEGSG